MRHGGRESRAGGSGRLVELTSQQHTYNSMDNKPSFAERIKALKAAAETVMLEAQCMEAAEQRFAERRTSRRERAGR